MGTVRINSAVSIEEYANGVVQITLHDRVNKNMFTNDIIDGLMLAYQHVGELQNCKAVIVTGFDSYFSSGGTQESLLSLNETRGNFSDVNIYSLSLECSVPVISAIQGHAIGGGFVMGLFSDVVILSRESYYTLNFMKYGFTPGMGATLIVPKKLGINLGNEMLLSAAQYRGDALEKRGVEFEVLPRKEVLPRAHEIASHMAQKPLESLRLLKQHLVGDIKSQLPGFVEQELMMHGKTMHQPQVANNIRQLFGRSVSGTGDTQSHDESRASGNNKNDSVEPSNLNGNALIDQAKNDKNVEVHSTISPIREAQNRIAQYYPDTDIAIISVAGRFPEAKNVEEYWENIRLGRDCIRDIPEDREFVEQEGHFTGECRWGGFVHDVDKFDPLFFKISPREALLMDPQERLLLEEVWNLLENVGYTSSKLSNQFDNRVAVYTASMYQQYHAFNTEQDKKAMVAMSSLSSMANRISHFFDFSGPSMAIDTMCSASATAVHLACRSLIFGESRLAIVGAANLSIHPWKYQALGQSQLLAKQQHIRGFGDAGGFLPAETVGAVLLKPLGDAVADGDNVIAVIKGTSINHKGSTDGFSVSNPEAISELIKDGLNLTKLKPQDIDYIETSVAGAEVSDIAEIKALQNVFGDSIAQSKDKLPIGTVKSTIGHAEAASGLTQLIKVAMQLKCNVLTPTINHHPVNAALNLQDTVFRIQDKKQSWKSEHKQRPNRAIINTLGAGGSGSIMLLEEYIPAKDSIEKIASRKQKQGSGKARMIRFSARTEERLREVVKRHLIFLDTSPKVNLDNFAYTLHEGREAMPVRFCCVVSSQRELTESLKCWLEGEYRNNTFFYDLDGGTVNVLQGSELRNGDISAKLLNTAKNWVLGEEMGWFDVYPEQIGCLEEIIPLPNYPFARRYCWLPKVQQEEMRPQRTNNQIIHAHSELVFKNTDYLDSEDGGSVLNGMEQVDAAIKNMEQKVAFIGIESNVVEAISEVLGLQISELNLSKSLKDLGVTSITKMLIVSLICQKIETLDESQVSTALSQLDTARAFVEHIEQVLGIPGNEHTESLPTPATIDV